MIPLPHIHGTHTEGTCSHPLLFPHLGSATLQITDRYQREPVFLEDNYCHFDSQTEKFSNAT
ncbi:uncharacterized protein MELLADRAFT_92260 [Melampsora larici-populina 98AG31]|uniref:Uncharacterized protein n=1 Tax=Melampsora larici-populina (strain 98AG31 / pathotype 3-4-7) TaxID=747676 RepID=F4R8Z9_MELLP|nr:uncharacterized protein MELLADRAFT_92260 [Melampsora larici-populina 98AG31]EGG11241.1 hypothetical protein MELLADRAFT_92260 [Melampsora larici-populina 98AG31]